MTDMNFVDILFGSGNTVSHMEDCKLGGKEEEQLEWISDDFLDSILQLCTNGSNPLIDQFLEQENDTIKSITDRSSDSGWSNEDTLSERSIRLDDDFLVDAKSLVSDTNNVIDDKQNVVLNTDSKIEALETMNYVKEEEIECEEVFESVCFGDTSFLDGVQNTFIVQQVSQSDEETNFSFVNFSTDNGGVNSKHEVLNIIPRSRTKRFKTSNSNIQRLHNKRKFSKISEGTPSDGSDFVYTRLHLTHEEQKLVIKEGIKLPAHYPLTKSEERDLKRIRRKIRNKISAQDSRRRKKEYVDSLEERVKRESEENFNLLKRIKTLEHQKMTLAAQVRKLQAALARCSAQTAAQPTTCLLLLVMSLALILAPNLRNTTTSLDNTDDEGISMSEEGSPSFLNERLGSRNSLVSGKNVEGKSPFNAETAKLLAEQLQKMQMTDGNMFTSALEMLKFGKFDSSLKEHDYFLPRKRFAADFNDGSWSPTRIYSKIMEELRNVRCSLGVAKKQKNDRSNSAEPIIINLCD